MGVAWSTFRGSRLLSGSEIIAGPVKKSLTLRWTFSQVTNLILADGGTRIQQVSATFRLLRHTLIFFFN